MSKQDRQGVRTPADIERKYDLSQLNKLKSGSGASAQQFDQLRQTLAQFMTNTNGEIDSLQEQINNINNGGGGLSSAVVFADQTTGTIYSLYVSDGNLMFGEYEGDITTPSNNATLTDDTTGKVYKLYVSNGKLTLAESEE